MTLTIARRSFLAGTLATGATFSLAACAQDSGMTPELWKQWIADWQRMQAIVRKRQWDVTPLKIEPPATSARLKIIEARSDLKFPPQLRDVLTLHSASVQFGWFVPGYLRPMDRIEHLYPTSSGIRDHVFDLKQVSQQAIPNFFMWKKQLAQKDLSEAKNRPDMWENQFPFGHLKNGDILTIDTSNPDPKKQPVRYFSHELEGWHYRPLAPDFITFMSVFSANGCAGTEQDSMAAFMEADTTYLSATGKGAKRWQAYLAKDPAKPGPDEPPMPVLGTTAADRALLSSARDNNIIGVAVAFKAGAKPDAIWNPKWGRHPNSWGDPEYYTAITYGVMHDNIAMLEMLLKSNGALNTRFLAANAAVEFGSLESLKWVIGKNARVNGWKHQRHWPLHKLVWQRGRVTDKSRADYIKAMTDLGINPALAARFAPRPLDRETYRAMLSALLEADADPDAPWDNGLTMLMVGGVETVKLLLQHGADVNARDKHGKQAIHSAQIPELVRLLAANKADVNARVLHAEYKNSLLYRPLQAALMHQSWKPNKALVDTLLELGAKPHLTDGNGLSTLAYCSTVEDMKRMQAFGLDARARLTGGRTLLHNMVTMFGGITHPKKKQLFLYLLSIGTDINAKDFFGLTMLHLLAKDGRGQPAEIKLALENGANKSIKDSKGRTAFDLAPKSLKEQRLLLAVPPR